MIVRVDADKCGLGQGAACCAFLAMATDGNGFVCGRSMEGFEWAIRLRLLEETMNAKYAPAMDTPFPDCQEGAGAT
jgi:hypothetical protein